MAEQELAWLASHKEQIAALGEDPNLVKALERELARSAARSKPAGPSTRANCAGDDSRRACCRATERASGSTRRRRRAPQRRRRRGRRRPPTRGPGLGQWTRVRLRARYDATAFGGSTSWRLRRPIPRPRRAQRQRCPLPGAGGSGSSPTHPTRRRRPRGAGRGQCRQLARGPALACMTAGY